MKKEEIRKEFFKLRIKGHSYNQSRKILLTKYNYEVHNRTLQRWDEKLRKTEWDLKDKSKRPKTIYKKLNPEIEKKIIEIRNKTGWGQEKICNFVPVSHWTVNKVLRENKLTEPNKRKRKRIKYIRWQRKHPNSLWQIDHSDQKIEDKWVISIIDDCSRKSLAFLPVNRVTTTVVVKVINDLIKVYGKPREILTDNGGAYGLKSKHSKFDRELRKRGIKHIRGAIHSPTTQGKVERLFQTFKREIKFCKNPELWRMKYNHFRPHMSLNGRTPDEIYNDLNLLF